MSLDNTIFIHFLLLLSVLFIVPKILFRLHIPIVTSEILLGIVLGMFWPSFFYSSDFLDVIASIGIITFFIYSGIEADVAFITFNLKVFLQSVAVRVAMLIAIVIGLVQFFDYALQLSSLIALAFIVPSAAFIVSSLQYARLSARNKKFISAKVITSEVFFIFLLIFFLNLDNLWKALGVLVLVLLWTSVLPSLLEFLYLKAFSRVIGVEFPLLFFIGLISAVFTEWLGLHFLLGAFIAGLFIDHFLHSLKHDNKITETQCHNLGETFHLMAKLFMPFYFFSVGLTVTREHLVWSNIGLALSLFIGLNFVHFFLHYFHRRMIAHESRQISAEISMLLLPSLIFTIIIGDLLHHLHLITDSFFAVLVLYAIFSSFLPFIATYLRKHSIWEKARDTF